MGDPDSSSGAGRAKGRSRLRRTLDRWAEGDDAHLTRERRRRSDDAGERLTIDAAPDREPVTLRGTLRSVTVRPRGGVPALEAELSDGSGVLTLVWLGRRRIAGIDAGRGMLVTGRIGRHGQDRTRILYNPRYELLS